MRLSYCCLSSSAGSIGTSLASQSSHFNNAFFYSPASLSPWFPLFFRRAFFSQTFVFVGLFLIGASMLSCCRRASTPHTQHSKAQSALHKAASTCRSARDNASKQRELARANMSSSIYTARCVLKTNEEIEICPTKYTIQPPTKQLKLVSCAKDSPLFPISRSYNTNTALSLCPLHVFRTCMRRPGCFPGAWSS